MAGEILAIIADGTTLVYFASDHLGYTSLVMDAAGAVLSKQHYKPYGKDRIIEPPFQTR